MIRNLEVRIDGRAMAASVPLHSGFKIRDVRDLGNSTRLLIEDDDSKEKFDQTFLQFDRELNLPIHLRPEEVLFVGATQYRILYVPIGVQLYYIVEPPEVLNKLRNCHIDFQGEEQPLSNFFSIMQFAHPEWSTCVCDVEIYKQLRDAAQLDLDYEITEYLFPPRWDEIVERTYEYNRQNPS